MSPTTWDQMANQEKLAKSLSVARPLEKMHIKFAVTEGKKCGDCRHLYKVFADMQVKPFKCRKYGSATGASTDWRLKWQACGLFLEDTAEEATS